MSIRYLPPRGATERERDFAINELIKQLGSGGAAGAYATRSEIKSLKTTQTQWAYLTEARREGPWVWRTGNFASLVALDTTEALFMASSSVAATSGAWVRIYSGPVLAGWCGASHAASDNSAALSAWIRLIVELNLHGCLDDIYSVEDDIGISAPSNTDIRFRITATPFARIDYTGVSRQERLLTLQFSNLKQAHIEGLKLDCNDLCSSGIFLRSLGAPSEGLVVRNCKVRDLTIKTGSVNNGFGIFVGSENAYPGTYGEVTGCDVNGMHKDSGVSLSAQGIAVVNFDLWKCDHNRVAEIHHDGVSLVDADGIAIISGNVSSVYNRETGSCCHNVVRNAAGRAIKLQVNGNARVANNTGHLNGAIELIVGYRFIDSQTGNAKILDNILFADDQWTGGSESTVLMAQTPATITSDNERVTIECVRNQIWTKKRFSRFFQPIIRDVAADVDFVCNDNRAYGNQALTGTTSSAMAIDIFTVVTMVTLTNGGKFRIRSNGNEVQTNNWFLLSGSVSGDYYNDVYIEMQDNTKHPLSVATPVFAATSTWYTSDLLLARNNIGSNGSRVDQNLDLTKLRAGCAFYLGSGTYTGGPLSPSFKAITKPTRVNMMLADGAISQWTADNGTTWRMVRDKTDLGQSAEHQAIASNANVTIGPSSGWGALITLTGTLTADRTMTLDTTGAIEGITVFKITRTGAGAFNWSIGGLKNLATNQWCEVAYNGSAYYLVSFGSL